MEIAIHPEYGQFYLPDEWEDELYTRYTDAEMGEDRYRADPAFVAAIRAGDPSLEGLVIEHIPDTATDWMIEAFDGSEVLIYCDGGRLYTR